MNKSKICKYLKHIFKDDYEQSDGKYTDIVGCCGLKCYKTHKFVIDENCFKVDNIHEYDYYEMILKSTTPS